jgi:formate/nitrite transporter FocA (FNT family)
LSGLAAGLSMGFSFLTQALLRADLAPYSWSHLIDSLGYCIGFIIAILGQQQLFTESTVTAMLPVLTRGRLDAFRATGRLWVIVLASNLAGTWIFASLLLPKDIFRPEVITALRQSATDAIPNGFGATFLKAVFAGWLIALMVWLLPSARSARIWTILIVTYVVALGRLSHVIAGSVEAGYAVMSHLATMSDYVLKFLLPTLLGNIVGGVALVALLNHGSIAAEISPDAVPSTLGPSPRKKTVKRPIK